MGEWIAATKSPNVGKEFWRPSYPGEWPEDEAPDGAAMLREPMPAPCARCGGRLWRWRSDNSGLADYRHERALRAWEALGSRGPKPERERAEEWLSYRLDHFRECIDFKAGPSMIEPIRPRLRVAE